MARKEETKKRWFHKKKAGADGRYENEEVAVAARQVKEQRKQRKKKARMKRLLILAILILIVLGLILIYKGTINLGDIWNWCVITVTGGENGDGYPTELEGNNVLQIEPIDNKLIVLSERTLTVYNKSAGIVTTRTHSFATPLLKVNGKHILLAEIGGTRLQVQTVAGQVREYSTEHDIISADLAKNGSFAVVTGSDNSHQSEVLYYKAGKKSHSYRVQLAEDLATDVALRDDGHQLAVIGLCSNGGIMQSQVLVYNTGSAAEPSRYTRDDVMLCSVDYLNNNMIAAVGDTEAWTIRTASDKINVYSYSNMKLLGSEISGNQIGLVLQNYGATTGCQLVGVDKGAEEDFRITYEDNFRDLAFRSGGGFLLLRSNTIDSVSPRGKDKQTEAGANGLMISSAFFGDAAVLGLTILECYNI